MVESLIHSSGLSELFYKWINSNTM